MKLLKLLSFKIDPEDTVIDQKVGRNQKNIKSIISEVRYEKNG